MFEAHRSRLCHAFLAVSALGLLAASACSGGNGAPSVAAVPDASGPVAAPFDRSRSGGTRPYVAVVVGDQPLVYYRLNERSGRIAADSSGNRRPATYVDGVGLGRPPLFVTSPRSHSASFESGYAMENVTWTQQAVSAECWVKPTEADVRGNPRIIDNAWTDHSGNGFMLWIDNRTFAFNTGWLKVSHVRPLAAARVYHVVGTYDAVTGATLYVDGVAVGNVKPGPVPNPQRGDGATTYVGTLNATAGGFGFTDFFQGDLSDCAIYDHALTPASVAMHYDVGANAQVTPGPIPTQAPTPTAPPPTPTPSPIAYDAKTACIDGTLYANDVLPHDKGEFSTTGLDREWWSRKRGNPLGGNRYAGFQVSWGRHQYDTYFGDEHDGISTPADDPFAVGTDANAPGSPRALSISAKPMPAHLIGNPQVGGATYYSGVLDTPVEQRYGFFAARVRLPAPKPGMSPAFWLLSNDGMPQGQHGPLAGEWDAQEMFGNDLGNGMNSGNIVWNSGASKLQNWGGTYGWPTSERSSPAQDYHDYGVLLDPGGAKISPNDYGPGGPGYAFGHARTGATNYLDGVPLYGHTGGADMTQGVAWKELMAMFQVGPKGGWLGSPSPADFPAYYWIEWIRVYRPTHASC